MKIIDTVQEMQNHAMALRAGGARLALVPTMGYLHEGHASLMREARRRADVVVASIFVNPAQFGAGEDFDTYPRDLDRDAAIAEAAGVDVIFTPKASDMYPDGYQTQPTRCPPLIQTLSRPRVFFFGEIDVEQEENHP